MNRRNLVLLLAGCGVACGPERDFDLDAPRVLEISPRGPLIRIDDSFRARFSEAMNPLTVSTDTVALVPRTQVSEAFVSDFNNPPLSDSRRGQVVPVDVVLSGDGTELDVMPLLDLEPRTAYSLLLSAGLRDTAGNPLVDEEGTKATFRFDVTTDDGPPHVVSNDIVSAQTAWVALNRKRFSVSFDQPVRNLTRANFRLFEPGSGFEPQVEMLEIDETRLPASLVLATPATGCERLQANTEYVVSIGPGVLDDEGEEMSPVDLAFTTGASCDVTPNVMVGAPLVVAGESAASIRFDTSKASSTEVRYGLAGGALDCLGRSCPVRGAPSWTPSPNAVPVRFVHAVDISGLDVNVSYAFQVRAEDAVGFVALADGRFDTAPLPKVAISEILADAPAGATTDANGEFIELYNFGEETLDLGGFALTLDGGSLAGGSTCEFPTGATAPVLAPGAFLVVGNANFDAAAYGAIDPSVLYLMSTGYICGRGLPNDRAQSVGLIDPDGRPVSSFGGYPALKPRPGQSVERVAEDAPDVEASFCYSRSDTGPTPGSVNGVQISGCES